MSDFNSVFHQASQLNVNDRLRLIDALASSVPDDQPPRLSNDWLAEIDSRASDIDSGAVSTEDWKNIRDRLFAKHGLEFER